MADFGIGEAAALAAAAGTAISATGAIVSGVQQSQAAKQQSKFAEQQAQTALQAGAVAEQETRDRTHRLMAAQRAAISGSGVDTAGTPLMTLLDTASEAELAAERARYSGQVTASGFENEASLYRQRANNAIVGGVFGGGTTLLTGAARTALAYGARNVRDPLATSWY